MRRAPLKGRELSLPNSTDELGCAGWSDLIDEARGGLVQFDGGELRISVTPAMTLIDVDGYLDPQELAIRGAGEAAKAIRRLDIGGSIGIDLPTSGSKAARQAAAAAIDAHLPQPFERTAVNGFGFVQIVRPRSRASADRTGARPRRLRGARAAPPCGVRAPRSQAPCRAPGSGRRSGKPPRLAGRARCSNWRRRQLAGRPRPSHVRRICRKLLNPSDARSAAGPRRSTMLRFAAPAVRTATC